MRRRPNAEPDGSPGWPRIGRPQLGREAGDRCSISLDNCDSSSVRFAHRVHVLLAHRRDELDLAGNQIAGIGLFPQRTSNLFGSGDYSRRIAVYSSDRRSCLLCPRGVVGDQIHQSRHVAPRRVRLLLDRRHDIGDLGGCRRGPFREFSHVVGNDREATALLAGPGRLDGRMIVSDFIFFSSCTA